MRPILLIVAGVLALSFARSVEAQPLGTFRWQLQPYCNIVSVAVTQNGSVYRLEGTDDQCGATTAASATGVAFANPDGTIGFGLAVVSTPGGGPVHIDATITLATLSGTWRDSSGANGTFAFTPGAGTGGSARPVGGGIGAAAVNAQQVQLRVAGSCAAGEAIRSIDQAGAVTCQGVGSGDITDVVAGAGLTGGASSGSAALAVAFGGSGSAATAARSDHTHGDVQFRIIGNATQSVADGTFAILNSWLTPEYNDGGGTYTAVTGRYTIPVTGLYHVAATILWQGTFTGQAGFRIDRNLTERIASTFAGIAAATTIGTIQHASTVTKFNAGDTVRVQVFQSSGAPRTLALNGDTANLTVTLIR